MKLQIGHRYGIEQSNFCHIGVLSGSKKSNLDPKYDLVYLEKINGNIIGFAYELIEIKEETINYTRNI